MGNDATSISTVANVTLETCQNKRHVSMTNETKNTLNLLSFNFHLKLLRCPYIFELQLLFLMV